MSKIKFVVMGISEKELGSMLGNLIQGEVDGEAEVMVCAAATPLVYSIDSAGTVRKIDFDRFLSQVVTNTRRQIAMRGPVEKAVQEVVKIGATQSQSEVTGQ